VSDGVCFLSPVHEHETFIAWHESYQHGEIESGDRLEFYTLPGMCEDPYTNISCYSGWPIDLSVISFLAGSYTEGRRYTPNH
jgi:hypothetical protein